MRLRVVIAAAMIAAAIGFMAPVPQGTALDDEAVLRVFHASVADYVALRTAATASLPPLNSSQAVEKIRDAVDARHTAIASARTGARRGDLFSKPAGVLFRTRIKDALASHDLNEVLALATIDEETTGPVPMIVVNGRFPWNAGYGMLPCLVQGLPPLPAGLEYRFVHTSLVLVDVDADLIVDILPEAILEAVYA